MDTFFAIVFLVFIALYFFAAWLQKEERRIDKESIEAWKRIKYMTRSGKRL